MKKAKIIVSISLIIGCLFISYWIINTNRAMVAPPDAFCFSIEGSENDYKVYSVTDDIVLDEDATSTNSVWDHDAVHLYIDSKYLNNEWNYVYITGNYWYSPIKPTITVNGQDIAFVETDTSRGSTKNYHFYLYEIKENTQYTITVRCGKDRERIKVVFHAD